MAWRPLLFNDFRGGRNGSDPSTGLSQRQVVEALNVDFWDGLLGRRRGGATALSLTAATFTGQLSSLLRHVETDDETLAQLFGVCSDNIMNRRTTAGWSAPTLKDAISGNAQFVNGVSFNGKFYLAYDSAQNRLHCWDGSTVRRVGLAAPTATATGAKAGGSVTDNRKYKTSVVVKTGSTYDRRSELSDATAVVNLAAQDYTVSLAGAPGEGETHWELWAASDDNNYETYHYIGEAAIGSTVVDSSVILTGDNPASIGTYNTPPSAKYLIADDARILMAGAWESSASVSSNTSPKNNRLWWTPVRGTLDVSDDERISNTTGQRNYFDFEEPITGIGAVDGVVYVFSYRSIWRLTPTGNVSRPYNKRRLTGVTGCIAHKSIVIAEDVAGVPTIYFLSHRGPMRIGLNGLEYCGNDVEDIWATINLNATNIVAHGLYHSDLHQVWFYIATGSSNDPDKKLIFDTRLGRHVNDEDDDSVLYGWCLHTGASCAARCSVMFSATVGASMSRNLKPYIGRSTGTAIWKADTTDQDDNGTTFQAYFETRPFNVLEGNHQGAKEPHVFARVGSATLTLTVIRDHGAESPVWTTTIAAVGSETKRWARFDGAAVSEAKHVAFRLGDGAAVAATWILDGLLIPVAVEEAFP